MSHNTLKRILAILLGLLLLSLLTVLVTGRQAVASALIGFSDFQEVAPGVYLEPGGTVNGKVGFLEMVKAAKARITSTYGEYTARPIVIVGHSEKILRYGNRFGSAHFFPWNSYIVIGPDGRNIDVIAHELVHAELVHRIGTWNRMTQIPAWFEEGIAMQVDYRKPFDFEHFNGKAAIGRDKLWWQAQFNAGGGDTVMFNYAASKEMVRGWRLRHSKSRFYELLKEIGEGRSFEEAFASNETKG